VAKSRNPIRVIAGALASALDLTASVADRIAGTVTPSEGAAPARPVPAPAPPAAVTELRTKMDSLLSRALEQSTASSQDELFHRILSQIVPDEARIISALSDGHPSPLVSVHDLTPAGMLGEALIENACLIGRMANVALTGLTPTYVGHLLSLGLVEVGPEDNDLKDEYQILLAETDVLAATRAGSRGPVPARVVRRTLSLSPLGHAFWAAAGTGA
jgi:hypothetical protein